MHDPEKQQQVQELVAACMKEAGFEYLPYVPTAPEPEPVLEGDLDWARTYGYGISTIDMAAPDPSDDPNTAITAAMSESERAAYQQALFGSSFQSTRSAGGPVAAAPPVEIAPPGVSADGSTAPPTGDADSAPGCVPTASAQVYGEPDVVDMQEFDTLFEALGKLQTSVEQDPRVVPLVAAWSDCMADAGHPGFKAVDDARNSIMSRWADLNGWEFTPVEGGGGSVSVASGDEVTEPDPAKVAEIRDRRDRPGRHRSGLPSGPPGGVRRRSGPNSSRSSSTSTAASWSAIGTRRAAGTDAVPPPADRHHLGLRVARRGGWVHRGVVRALPRRVGGPQHAAAGRSDLRSGDQDGAAVEGGHPRRRQLFRSRYRSPFRPAPAPRC